jgi:uncharacterized membrane protein
VPAAEGESNPPVFHARLTPHRSLSRPGFIVLMALVGLVSFVGGIVFLALGAWPITGFFGLDVALLFVAFRMNYRDARQFEILEIRDGVLTLMQVDRKGRVRDRTFNPYWVSVRLREATDGRRALALASHGQEHAFGAFLNDDEKADVADLLQRALLRARGMRV